MDPLRSDQPEQLDGVARDAQIEQLLLTGLDHYFAADYEQAINIWTRVLFLDRQHDRARAYIERARSAQAERQRESEAVLHQGIEAFKAGDVDRARALIDQALDQGAPRDLVLGILDRIARLGVSRHSEQPSASPHLLIPPATSHASGGLAAPRRTALAGASGLLLVAALGAVAVAVWGVTLPNLASLPFLAGERQAPLPIAPAIDEPLPMPSATEAFLTRARVLFATGRLRDALAELDRIPLGDSLHADADRLRADIQRELLTIAAAEHAPATPSSTAPR